MYYIIRLRHMIFFLLTSLWKDFICHVSEQLGNQKLSILLNFENYIFTKKKQLIGRTYANYTG